MRVVLLTLAALFSLLAFALAQNQNTASLPTWQDELAKGFVPYRQLTVADFPINDHAHPDAAFWVKALIDPRYIFHLKQGHGGYVYAYISEWVIFSGLDKNECSRKSWLRKMKVFCEARYEQIQAECDALDKATDKGRNKKKVRELAVEIRKRLDATPAVNLPANVVPNPATAPSPSATATTPALSATASPTFR
jgi:hypothetical protein